MRDNFDSIEKLRFIHGLMKKEVEELIKFVGSDKLNVSETNTPHMDVVINESEVLITVELAGLTTEDFTVYQYDDLVIIEGVRTKVDIPKCNFVRVERETGRFKRVLRLPFNVNDFEAKASLKEGVLEIRICIDANGCDF